MRSIFALIAALIIVSSFAAGSVSRLYVGELDGQFMAGVDTRIDFKPFFVGGDVRTIIRKTLYDQNKDDLKNKDELETTGFLPDRTDYKTSAGIIFGENIELEYAHTCYHRVISNEDLTFYSDNKNPGNTDTITLRVYF